MVAVRFGFLCVVRIGKVGYGWSFILILALYSLLAENCGSRGPTASAVIGWYRMTSLTLIRVKFLEKT